ncbi:MAG: DUF4440 domain-containing protein [Bacteroidetes bacterium]|nr:DUF4440 domain-containing protein [Bacteroidota bacterium]
MKRLILISFLCLIACSSEVTPDKEAIREEIVAVMQAQETAWNKGDIRGFMQGYLQSDSTIFVGKKRVNYGWENVLAAYLKGYPDEATMGKLHFDLIRIEAMDATHAYVIGKWTLSENAEPASGHFVLIFEKGAAGWRITVDGTS